MDQEESDEEENSDEEEYKNNKQKAEIACWLGRFDEAEEIYKTIDRKDLALDMRRKLGDWPRVV